MKPNKLYVIKIKDKQWAIGFIKRSRKPVRFMTMLPGVYRTREHARQWVKNFRHVAKILGESI